MRARQLKAQTVQRGLEEVAVRQIEIEKESVQIGEFSPFLSIFDQIFREKNSTGWSELERIDEQMVRAGDWKEPAASAWEQAHDWTARTPASGTPF